MAAIRQLLVLFSLALLVALAAPGMARAQEPGIIEALLDGFATRLQVRPTYGAIDTASDGTITVTGLVVKFPEGLDLAYDIETLIFKGVREVGDKRFEADSLELSGMSVKFAGQLVAAIPTMTSSGVFVRGLPANPTALDTLMAGSNVAREFTVPEVVILIADKSLKLENIKGTFEGDPWTYSGTQRMSLGRLAVPEEILALAGDEVPLKQLGYTSLEFSSDMSMQFDMSGENITGGFDLGFTGKDMGTLRMAGKFADVPFALLQTASAGEQADEAKLLEQASQISISEFSVRFDDASLTNRLLDFFAAAQQMDRTQLIATAAATVQIGLTELKNQDFTNRVIAAVNTFLAAPGSIGLTALPSPVKVEQLMKIGEDPAALMELLQVDVKANQ